MIHLSPRRFAAQLTALLCEHVLQISFGCQGWRLEVEGCDVLMEDCLKEPLAPNSCIESKYVEIFWYRQGTLLQTLKDAVAKLRRAMSEKSMPRFVLLSRFTQKKQQFRQESKPQPDKNIFKEGEPYVLVVVIMSSEIGKKNLQQVVEVVSPETKKYLKAEGLEAITNIGANIIYDELQEVKHEQQAIRQEQQATKQQLVKLEQLLNRILKKLDEE